MGSILARYQSAALTVETVWRLLVLESYTGPVTFHCRRGVPMRVEFGKPEQADLYVPGVSSLDKDARGSASSQTMK